jgi:hypothetical protein
MARPQAHIALRSTPGRLPERHPGTASGDGSQQEASVLHRIHIQRLGRRHAVIDPAKYSMSDAVAIMTGAMAPAPEDATVH